MLYHLLAVFAVGLGAWLLIWSAFRSLRRKPPRFLVPLAVGLSMMAYNIWDEYSWATRFKAQLPPRVEVIREIGQSMFWQPWTYLVPRVVRMAMIDTGAVARNESLDGYAMGEVILAERQGPTRSILRMSDCRNGRFAELSPADTFDANGLPIGATWFDAEPGDPVQAALCQVPTEAASNASR